MEAQTAIICPSCNSLKVHHSGKRLLINQEKIQCFECVDCGRKFSEKYIRCQRQDRAVHYALKGCEKMDTATELKTVTGGINGKLTDYHFKMRIDGYKDATVTMSWKILELLIKRGAELTKPETVKKVISEQTWSGNRRRNVINAYTQFLKYQGLSWEQPKNTVIRKIPFIPTEQEIDDLIAGMPIQLAAYCQILKETAMRSGEAIKLQWRDVDLERRVITCNDPEKGSDSRQFNDLSGKLLNMLSQLPKTNELVFAGKTKNSFKAVFTRCRAKQAFKLGNSRLKEIHLHSFRHWKATMLYHYTKDIIAVQQFLGHRFIENTQLYIQLDKKLFANVPDDKFIIRAVNSIEEATQLGEVGFEPFMVIQGVQLMRKRK
jgi:integrase